MASESNFAGHLLINISMEYLLRTTIISCLTCCLLILLACTNDSSINHNVTKDQNTINRDSKMPSLVEPTARKYPGKNSVESSNLQKLFDTILTDVSTGDSFYLGDNLGKVQVIETMAVWCTRCNRQQKEMAIALQKLGSDILFISVDVDPNENEEILKRYVENNGFSWPFVVPGSEFSQNLSLLTSKMVLDPTATPVIIIDSNGKLHVLAGEIKSSSFLLTEINKHSN